MPQFTATILAPAALPPEDIRRWSDWMKASEGLGSAFLSYRYAFIASGFFHHVRIARLEQDGKTAGFFPFQFHSPLHRLMGWGQRLGGELSDYFGLVARPGVHLTDSQLLKATGLTSLYFTHLDESQSAFGLTGEQPEPGLRIEFPEGGAAFWEARRSEDKKFTGDTERRARKLVEAHGPLRFTFHAEDPLAALEALMAAKRAQYARTGAADSLIAPRSRKFLRALAADRSGDPDCRPVMSTLHAGETWVASHFGLRAGGTLHYWFPAYNPAMRAFAPGRLLVKAFLDSSAETGLTMIDRGSGDSPAKKDFATSRHLFRRGLWARPGLAALAHRAGLSAQWRFKAWRGARADSE